MKVSLKDFLARKEHESLIRIIDGRILDAKCRDAMASMDATLARSRKIRESIKQTLKQS